MAESAHTKACPFCGERILAAARKCKHCRSTLVRRDRPAASVPWYRRAGVVLAGVFLLPPAAVLVLFTGPVYGVTGDRAVAWRGWRLRLANFAALSITIFAALALVESVYRPGCRSGEVAQLLGELAQRQVVEAQGLLTAALPPAQGPLKMSVSVAGARDAPGSGHQCVATAQLKVTFPRLAEPVEGTADLKYVVDPTGWAKVYVHVADAGWINVAFGQAQARYVQKVGGAR